MPFATTWVKLENIMPSEISEMETDKYHMVLLVHEIRKKNTTKLINRERD